MIIQKYKENLSATFSWKTRWYSKKQYLAVNISSLCLIQFVLKYTDYCKNSCWQHQQLHFSPGEADESMILLLVCPLP